MLSLVDLLFILLIDPSLLVFVVDRGYIQQAV
jgi:hypothetical protein